MNWQFYTKTPEAWQAMLFDCANARFSIDLDQYIFEPDQIGLKFIELFMQKAKQGVRVRMICDAVGSVNFYNSDWPQKLSEAGIQVLFFNPISPWRLHNFTSWFFRNHKKMLIIDKAVAHTGGVGINQMMASWRDTNVRLTGTIVNELDRLFAKMLEIARRKRFIVIQNNSDNGSDFRFLISSPFLRNIRSFRYRKRYLRDTFIESIKRAKNYIYLTTPYFVPDFRFFHVLQKAAKKGLDVRLLLPTASDYLSLDMAASSHFGLALSAGVRIFKYKGGLLHAKTVVIDDTWGTIGSANLDNLSFWFSYEANIVSTNLEFNQELKTQFLGDCENADEVLPETWNKRPYSQKILELLTWPAHNFM